MAVDTLVERNDFLIKKLVKPFLDKVTKKTCIIHSEMPISTLELLSSGTPVAYTGLHKSMWSPIGIPYILFEEYDLPIPYAIMAHSLVSGNFAHWFMGKMGADFTVRGGGRSNLESTICGIQSRLRNKESIMIFPGKEKGRTKNGLYKTFETTVFDALIKMGEERWIVPFNVDYSIVNEIRDLKSLADFTDKHYVFKVKDFAQWFKKLGDIYVSFGDPIMVTPDMDRVELASMARSYCLDLVKILEENIISEAALRLSGSPHINPDDGTFHKKIYEVMQDYAHQSEKFRGFDINTPPIEIIKNSMIPVGEEFIGMYNIYANYPRHYLKDALILQNIKK